MFVAGLALWIRETAANTRISLQITRSLPLVGRNGGYLSSDSCQSCHPSQYASWHQTFHRTMTQVAAPLSVQAPFKNERLRFGTEEFELSHSGTEYWTTIRDTAAPVDFDSEAITRRVGMVTGSHHMQVFWVSGGAGNIQLGFPFVWLIADKRWVPRKDVFLRDPAIGQPKEVWNTTCIRCHTTAGQPRPDEGAGEWKTRTAELGIGCEACHGPGENHVRANQNPARRYALHVHKGEDPTIVQPARLDHVRSSQVCANCHGIKWFESTEEFKQNGFAFKPGDDLEQTTPIVRPGQMEKQPWLKPVLERHPELMTDFFWPDGMVRNSGREYNGLIESPCFQRGNLSCLSCHSMHESAPDDQLGRGKETNEACFQCHDSLRKTVTAHTHHTAGSSGSLCYNCHMPHTTYGLLKAIRSHQIDSPSVATNLATGRPNACNLCHLDRTLEWTALTLEQWFGQEKPALSEDTASTAASVLWALRGDAGQRALAAWSMGWKSARETSGETWIAPHLATLLEDPYSAVRYIAYHSLKELPEFGSLDYDYVGSPDTLAATRNSAIKLWKKGAQPTPLDRARFVLMNEDGTLDESAIARLLSSRDNRPVHLRE